MFEDKKGYWIVEAPYVTTLALPCSPGSLRGASLLRRPEALVRDQQTLWSVTTSTLQRANQRLWRFGLSSTCIKWEADGHISNPRS